MDTAPKIPPYTPMPELDHAGAIADLSPLQRLAMLLLNLLPLAHLTLIAAGVWFFPYNAAARAALAVGLLYLLPPILARLILWLLPIRETHMAAGNGAFLTWWSVFSLQVLFLRLPFLEELLRIVPGAYSAWLRLWGSRIGRLTYWAPGVIILDRPFLRLGNDVILGAGVHLNPHVMARNAEGRIELILAPVTIGNGATIGGYSLLTAGTEIADRESTRAYLISPPFSKWSGGKRVNPAPPENTPS